MAVRERVAVSGSWGRLIWARAASGRYPAEEFYLGLTEPEKAKVNALFRLLANRGRISSKRKFRYLAGAKCRLSELKSGQLRFLGDFRPGRRYLLAIGLKKKQDKQKQRDLDRACRILADHDFFYLEESEDDAN